jgi:hypothetical protein
MDLSEEIAKRRDRLPVYGLGMFLVIAGLSKFLILDFWLGYEPQFIIEILPATVQQLVLAGGVFEAVLGTLLLSGKRTFHLAVLVSLWFLVITFQMVKLGFWDLAIRDLGLTFYALSVAATSYRKS